MLKIVENLWAVGAMPRIPLKELTVLPRPLCGGGEGLLALPNNPTPFSAFSSLVFLAPNEKSRARPWHGFDCYLLPESDRICKYSSHINLSYVQVCMCLFGFVKPFVLNTALQYTSITVWICFDLCASQLGSWLSVKNAREKWPDKSVQI